MKIFTRVKTFLRTWQVFEICKERICKIELISGHYLFVALKGGGAFDDAFACGDVGIQTGRGEGDLSRTRDLLRPLDRPLGRVKVLLLLIILMSTDLVMIAKT